MIRILLVFSIILCLPVRAEHATGQTAGAQGGGGFGTGAALGGTPATPGRGADAAYQYSGTKAREETKQTGEKTRSAIQSEGEKARQQISSSTQDWLKSLSNLKVPEDDPAKTLEQLSKAAQPKESKPIAGDTVDAIVKGLEDDNKVNVEWYKALASALTPPRKQINRKPSQARRDQIAGLGGTQRISNPLSFAMGANTPGSTGVPNIGGFGQNNTGSAKTISNPNDILHPNNGSGGGDAGSAGGDTGRAFRPNSRLYNPPANGSF